MSQEEQPGQDDEDPELLRTEFFEALWHSHARYFSSAGEPELLQARAASLQALLQELPAHASEAQEVVFVAGEGQQGPEDLQAHASSRCGGAAAPQGSEFFDARGLDPPVPPPAVATVALQGSWRDNKGEYWQVERTAGDKWFARRRRPQRSGAAARFQLEVYRDAVWCGPFSLRSVTSNRAIWRRGPRAEQKDATVDTRTWSRAISATQARPHPGPTKDRSGAGNSPEVRPALCTAGLTPAGEQHLACGEDDEYLWSSPPAGGGSSWDDAAAADHPSSSSQVWHNRSPEQVAHIPEAVPTRALSEEEEQRVESYRAAVEEAVAWDQRLENV